MTLLAKSPTLPPLWLAQDVLQGMLEHAQRTWPEECVGLLWGDTHNITHSITHNITRQQPLPNIAAEPQQRYLADPQALLQALQQGEAQGQQLQAIYHSHPRGPMTPSKIDLEHQHYRVPQLIIVPQPGIVRAFDLTGDSYLERSLIVYRCL